jgi:hypothetical protein
MPNLTLWYRWQYGKGTLPEPWARFSLPEVARALGMPGAGTPVWQTVRPWRVETPGVAAETREGGGKRITAWETPAGTLTTRWTLGPDGDWWQAETLVKDEADLPAAVALARARTYVLDRGPLAALQAEVGENGVVALELPRRPYSDLLHDYLGWGEGLFMLGEPAVAEILAALEAALADLVAQVVDLPGQIVYCPDNLDGQYISPAAFARHLSESYRRTAEAAQAANKHTLVHAGGPVRHLLAPLAATGVDGVEGVAGPPQSDASLAEARALAGPDLTLWGGISQDLLLETYEQEAFEAAVRQAAREASGDPRTILGVADRVPVDADLERLAAIASLVSQ